MADEDSNGAKSHSDAESVASEHSGSEHSNHSDIHSEANSDKDVSGSESGGDSPVAPIPSGSDIDGKNSEDENSNHSDNESEHSQAESDKKNQSEDEEGKKSESDGKKSDSEDQDSGSEEDGENKADRSEDEDEKKNHMNESGSEKEKSPKGSDSELEDKANKRKSGGSSSDNDSKGSNEGPSPKKRMRVLSDGDLSSGAEDMKTKATAMDLFGDDIGDVSSDEEDNKQKKETIPDVKESANEIEERFGQEEDEYEIEEPPPETRIEVEIPRISTDLGREIDFVKLPNFLSVDTRPYDPHLYEDEIDEDEVLDEEGRARLKLKVENTIRWRHGADKMGNPKKESNARMVRWSDGSLSLHLGSEIFDVHKQSLMVGDHNHLFIRQGTGLQGQAVFKTKLSFRPHSTDSFTHRKMTLSLADRSQKTQKIRVLPNVGKDPEAHRSEMIKREEDRLKASIRRESKQRRIRDKSHGRGLSASYLEPDQDDDGAISLSAIKNKYKKGAAALRDRPSIYSSDEESGDEIREKRLEQAKNNEDDDDSDLDYFDKKKASAEGKKKSIMIEESGDEDD